MSGDSNKIGGDYTPNKPRHYDADHLSCRRSCQTCCRPAELIANICIVVSAILFLVGLMFLASYLAPNAVPKMTQVSGAAAKWLESDLLSLSIFSVVTSFALSFLGSSIKACTGCFNSRSVARRLF